MQDIVEQPSERDEEIYAAWESGKKMLRGLARQFGAFCAGDWASHRSLFAALQHTDADASIQARNPKA
jgi:hypothetical protein